MDKRFKIPLYCHFFDSKAVLFYDFNSCNFVLRKVGQPLFIDYKNQIQILRVYRTSYFDSSRRKAFRIRLGLREIRIPQARRGR